MTDVARRFGVARQTVHVWLRRYATDGLGGLADHSLVTSVEHAPALSRSEFHHEVQEAAPTFG